MLRKFNINIWDKRERRKLFAHTISPEAVLFPVPVFAKTDFQFTAESDFQEYISAKELIARHRLAPHRWRFFPYMMSKSANTT
jgi:hypothetical protein